MSIIGLVIGVGGVLLGFVMLVISLAMIAVYPWLLFVAIPLWYGIYRWVKAKFFTRRAPFTSRHLLTGQPEGHDSHMSHFIEPVTIGGHTRGRHQ